MSKKAVEKVIITALPPPYATVHDRTPINLCYGDAHRKASCHTVVVDGKEVWNESHIRQSSDNAIKRCNRLAKLIQEAYDKGKSDNKDV